MKIIILTKNFELDQDFKDYIVKKINSTEKNLESLFNNQRYYDSLFGKGKPKAEAWLEIGKTTGHHRKGEIFRAECQVRLPGKSVRVVARRTNLKQAVIEIKDKLQREFKEYKTKLIAKIKRGARILKKETHLSPEARFYRKGRILDEGI